MKATAPLALAGLCFQVSPSEAFTVSSRWAPGRQQRQSCLGKTNTNTPVAALFLVQQDNDANDRIGKDYGGAPTCWNPQLRRTMGLIAGAGAVETAYLTWTKLTGSIPVLCGTTTAEGGGGGSSSCSNVLDGPYAFVPGTDLPISLLGFVAYSLVGFLAVAPLMAEEVSSSSTATTMSPKDDESNNRLLLTAVCTTMGVFSVFLMALLFGVLKESCAFCVASAVFSVSLAKLCWLGGAVPSDRIKQGLQLSAGGGAAAFAASLLLFISAPADIGGARQSLEASISYSGASTQVLLASAGGKPPPPIVTSSSARAMDIAKELQSLDARMFGAYWCSHCYDQKERLGKEAMSNIPYIECSKEGLNQQNALCRERDVPGYPTWEISGKLYPGEKELEELEDIIKTARQ